MADTKIPYSGKFSLAQIFAELLAMALEIFTPSPRGDHAHIDQSAISRLIFSRHPTYPRKMRNFAPCENIPLYGIELFTFTSEILISPIIYSARSCHSSLW
jgi:hypothetical protein